MLHYSYHIATLLKLLTLFSSSGKTGKVPSSLTTQDYQVCITVIEARHLAGVNMDPVVCVQVSPGPLGSESNKIILWPITLGGWLQEVYFSQGINKLSLLQWGGGSKTNVEYFSSINFLFLVFCIWFPHGPCDALWQNHFVHGKTTAAQFNIIRFVLYMMCSNQTFHETKIIKTQGTRYFAKFIFFLFKGNAKAVP